MIKKKREGAGARLSRRNGKDGYDMTRKENMLAIYRHEKHDHIGDEQSMHSAFVHYDRGLHRVLNKKDIFQRNDAAIMAIINKKIDALNTIQLKHADSFPDEFQAKEKGICFHFAPGALADPAEGPIEIFVDYGSLRSVFTPAFKQLVDTNEGFWDYKHLSLD